LRGATRHGGMELLARDGHRHLERRRGRTGKGVLVGTAIDRLLGRDPHTATGELLRTGVTLALQAVHVLPDQNLRVGWRRVQRVVHRDFEGLEAAVLAREVVVEGMVAGPRIHGARAAGCLLVVVVSCPITGAY